MTFLFLKSQNINRFFQCKSDLLILGPEQKPRLPQGEQSRRPGSGSSHNHSQNPCPGHYCQSPGLCHSLEWQGLWAWLKFLCVIIPTERSFYALSEVANHAALFQETQLYIFFVCVWFSAVWRWYICLGVGVLLIINFAFLNFSLVFSKLSRSIIWCVNNVGNFSHHCFKYFFSILLFLLLNCYSYVHITHLILPHSSWMFSYFFSLHFFFSGWYRSIFKFKGILYFCCCLLFLAFLFVSILEFPSLLPLLIHFCHWST